MFEEKWAVKRKQKLRKDARKEKKLELW
jgi:hypothetical protein